MSPEVSVDVPEGDSYPHMDTPRLVVQTTQDGRRAALGVLIGQLWIGALWVGLALGACLAFVPVL